MAILAWFFGTIGGLCAVMGVVTAVDVVPMLAPELTWMFWMVLSAILFLITLVFTVSSTGKIE